MENNDIEFCATVEHETDKSLLVSDGSEKIWLPKSQIVRQRPIGSNMDFEFVIPQWLAKEKGII